MSAGPYFDSCKKPMCRNQGGATLIEQIMVLVVVASLAGMATPPLRKMLTRDQVQAAQTDMIAVLRHARETAVTRGRPALLCPTVDGRQCSNTSRWNGGWLLADDADRDSQPDGAPILRGAGYGNKLNIVSSTGRRFVHFYPDGSAIGSNLTLWLCSPASGDNALSVVIANSGRVRGATATPAQAASCRDAR